VLGQYSSNGQISSAVLAESRMGFNWLVTLGTGDGIRHGSLMKDQSMAGLRTHQV
jgi:hypothetical protein